MNLPSVEGLGVEGDGGRVAALGAADGHLPAQLHPGHREDGAGVGARQREDVLLVVFQEAQDAWEEEKEEDGNEENWEEEGRGARRERGWAGGE